MTAYTVPKNLFDLHIKLKRQLEGSGVLLDARRSQAIRLIGDDMEETMRYVTKNSCLYFPHKLMYKICLYNCLGN